MSAVLSIAAYKLLGFRPFERMYTSLAEGFHTISYFAGPWPSKLNILSYMQLSDDLQATDGVPGEPIHKIILLVGSDWV